VISSQSSWIIIETDSIDSPLHKWQGGSTMYKMQKQGNISGIMPIKRRESC
jgi:hypothetical protein